MEKSGGRIVFFFLLAFAIVASQEETHSQECKNALAACESDLECGNRLAPLMAACTTSTCQPQCRIAVLNVYQNRLGRALLRSDVSCVPGRDELRLCNFLPLAPVVHCSLARLTCEADLECNSAWESFVSECESESNRGFCSPRCAALLKTVTSTKHGSSLVKCTCTEKEDQLCQHLRDSVLALCNNPSESLPVPPPEDNSITLSAPSQSPTHSHPVSSPEDVSSSRASSLSFLLLLLSSLLVMRD